jgi:hypothetical protein
VLLPRLSDIYYLVVSCHHHRDVGERCLAVGHAVFEPALKALIGLDNVVFEVIPVVGDEVAGVTERALALTAHTRDSEEVKCHLRESWIKVLAALALPP